FEFVRQGKPLFAIEGHTGSVFGADKDVLYFAQFSRCGSGCTVVAHELTTGAKLWETKLSAVGTPQHSAYLNQVTMGVSKTPGGDSEDERVLFITGRESFGDYVEVLDCKTGTPLAHKVYRQGFAPIK